jgi:hypothetical protein
VISHDWHVQPDCQRSLRLPPERSVLDRRIHSLAVRPRTCCAACSRPCRVLSAPTEIISISWSLSSGNFLVSIAQAGDSLLRKTFKDRSSMPGYSRQHVGGHFALGGNFPRLAMDCSFRRYSFAYRNPEQSSAPADVAAGQTTLRFQVIGMG